MSFSVKLSDETSLPPKPRCSVVKILQLQIDINCKHNLAGGVKALIYLLTKREYLNNRLQFPYAGKARLANQVGRRGWINPASEQNTQNIGATFVRNRSTSSQRCSGEQLCVIDALSVCQRCLPCGLVSRRAVIHFQVQAAAVQSHFNTNCFLPDKGACALPLTPLCFLRACATLVAVDTKYQLLSQTFTKGVKKDPKKSSAYLSGYPTAYIFRNYDEVPAPLYAGCGQPGWNRRRRWRSGAEEK